jgi:hypothetical protein
MAFSQVVLLVLLVRDYQGGLLVLLVREDPGVQVLDMASVDSNLVSG